MEVSIIPSEELQRIKDSIEEIKSTMQQNVAFSKRQSIYDNEAVCKLLNVSIRCLQNYRDKGLISFSKVGKKIFYQWEDIQDFITKHRHETF